LVFDTEYSEPVVERDDDKATDDGKYARVVRVAGADVVRLAVYEYDNCQGSVAVPHCRHVAVARVCATTPTKTTVRRYGVEIQCIGYDVTRESATDATVSARQGRHLANTFEVYAIECLTWVRQVAT